MSVGLRDLVMTASRKSKEAFGMSVLDMLCCGFGAAALLFILKDLEGGTAGARQRQQIQELQKNVQSEAQSYRDSLRLSTLLNEVQRSSLTSSWSGAYAELSLPEVHRMILVV